MPLSEREMIQDQLRRTIRIARELSARPIGLVISQVSSQQERIEQSSRLLAELELGGQLIDLVRQMPNPDEPGFDQQFRQWRLSVLRVFSAIENPEP